MTTQRFAYKPKSLTMALAGGFFLVCTIVLFMRASENDRGIILNRMIEMDQGSTTIFFYVLTGLSALMTAGGVYGFVTSLQGQKFVVLDETGMELPGNAGQRPVRIPYASIRRLEPGGVNRQRWLYIHHAGGRHAIMGSLLANKAQLDEIADLIAARMQP